MWRRKKFRNFSLSTLDKLISCLEYCQEASQGPYKAWLIATLFTVLFCAVFWRFIIYDPCRSALIKHELCEQYKNGEIAGDLCYPLCIQHAKYLSYCMAIDDDKTFLWHETVFRVSSQQQSHWSLPEGTQMSKFRHEVRSFLEVKLGHSNQEELTERLITFADYNEDGKLSLGEAQSLWRLIHIEEFLLLFIFNDSSTFPSINGTCGHLFGFQHAPFPRLYDKNTHSWVKKLFKNSYKWEFPVWAKRARISLGMIEFCMDIYEEVGTKFVMCHVSPLKFGIGYNHEAMLTTTKDIAAEEVVKRKLLNTTCHSDHDCVFSEHCRSSCINQTSKCSGEIIRPSLWYVCDIIEEYLLYDTPRHLYYELKRLLDRCSQLTMTDKDADLLHAGVYQDLKTFLWKEIQYNPNA